MTSLIKGNSSPTCNAIRTLSWNSDDEPEGDVVIAPARTPPRDPEFAALERVIVELRCKLEEQETELLSAVEAARVDGMKQAELSHTRDDAKALAALQAATDSAVNQLNDRLATMEALALAMSQAALENVFANAQAYQDLVTRAISRQMSLLKKETVVRILVSAGDFTTDAAVQTLIQKMSVGNVEIQRDPQVQRGDCRIDLRLGRIELSISKHWENLQSLFRTLAEDKRP